LPDYYSILGISPDADREAIWRAFRRRAAECHPDRGGSHRDMVLINEAWTILSDPVARARFDESRRQAASLAVRQAFEQDQRQAREQAEQYPRQWTEYEKWLDSVSADIGAARYGSMEGFAGIPLPTVSNSLSAAILVGTGAVAGAAVAIWLIWTMEQRDLYTYVVSAIIVATGGAWLGLYMHNLLRFGMNSDVKATSSKPPAKDVGIQPAGVVVACAGCGQRLRLPRTTSVLAVTCPRCRSRFDMPPAA
jgi:hypothetical protein